MTDQPIQKRGRGRPKGSGVGKKIKPGSGRPPFKPTDEQRDTVEQMLAVGTTLEDIALLFGITTTTLSVHFADEIRLGRVRKRSEVVTMAFKAARNGNASMIKHLETMTGIAAIGRPAQYEVPAAEKEAPTPRPPKLGKKEEQLLAAQHPDTGTPMGELMAARQRGAIQ